MAYIVPATNASLSVSEICGFIGQKLSPHMVPSGFVMLDHLPLTPNGKVNRRALPDPGESRPDLDTPFVAPRTPVEAELSQIWAEILALEQVGVHDSFFDLGGHSLAATWLVLQVIKQFQLELPLQSPFQSPTVAEMAAVIMEHQGKQLEQEELERLLGELESLPDEEAQRLLAEETTSMPKGERYE